MRFMGKENQPEAALVRGAVELFYGMTNMKQSQNAMKIED